MDYMEKCFSDAYNFLKATRRDLEKLTLTTFGNGGAMLEFYEPRYSDRGARLGLQRVTMTFYAVNNRNKRSFRVQKFLDKPTRYKEFEDALFAART